MRRATNTGFSKSVWSKFKFLKVSWTYQLKEFFNNSNLHGVRFIAERNRPFHEKFIWFSFVLIGVLVALVIIFSLWEKFQTSPTITGLDTDFYRWDIAFPAVTVCPRNPIDNESVNNFISSHWGESLSEDYYKYYQGFVTKVANLSYSNLELLLPYEYDTELARLNLRNVTMNTVIRCERLFHACRWLGVEQKDCCEHFRPVLTDRGFCFTFNAKHFERYSMGSNVTDGSENMTIKYIFETDHDLSFAFSVKNHINVAKNPLSVYIHSSVERIGIDLQPHHVWTRRINKILFSLKETYTTENARQLSIKQRRCVFPDEIRLVTDDVYTFAACMTQCRMNMAKQRCGCVPFFYVYDGIEGYRSCNVHELACIVHHKNEIEKGFDCDCELGCMNTVYKIEKLEDVKDSPEAALLVSFVSWPLIRYKRDVLFGWVDLFVAFGGIAGLFLGFSVLTVVETFYFFTLRACCMVYQNEDKLKELQMQYENSEEPEINLDMKPYFVEESKKEEPVVLPYLP